MAVLVKPRTEGTHWYTPNGEPVHTRPNKDGQGEHNTNLVDARKLRLFPSVTNVLGILGKPGLEKWKISQVLLAMSKLERKPDEAKEVYFDRVVNEAFEQVDVAQDTGKGMHASMMAALQGRPIDEQYRPYVDKVFEFFDREGIECQTSEQTLVNHEFGFAGTMDFGGTMRGIPLVLDWKTRKTKPGQPITSYEVQPMQVSAYGATYWATRWPGVLGGNIYISSTEPGRIELIPYSSARMDMEWEAFKHACAMWQHIKGYNPLVAGTAAEVEGSELAQEKYQNVVISEPTPGAPAIIKKAPVITRHTADAEAMNIAATSPKQEERPKKTQDKGKKKAAKPTPAPKTKGVRFSPPGMGVKMPFGPHAGEFIANVEDAYLAKIWKFSRKLLAKHADVFEAVKERVEMWERVVQGQHNREKKDGPTLGYNFTIDG